MSSIYNKADNDLIITRIKQLTPESKPLWGKMTVDQMLKHCNEAIIVAFGENEIKVNFFLRLLGRMLKNKVLNSEFQKNSPTAKEFVFTEQYDFEEAQKEFISNFARFAQGPEAIQLKVHPFWGPMSDEDWNKLMWNHIDHHLRQFGV
ncbi:DUF1569 domain-containing protein [Flavobacterium mekongense]|uniref:DUF1569 domain-containing protein n=1 Tax=Flavobacterium mekongense TaxID=3379707 RepID=UPI00399B4A4C